MRTRILAESAKAATAGRQLARYEEAERIAGNLGDTVVRQLFTTSLALQSAASRYPMLAPVLTNATRDLDRALKDLQTAIFELNVSPPGHQPLGNQVLDLVDQFEVAPEVHLAGSLDGDQLAPLAADVVGVLREALTTVVRQAPRSTISLSASEGVLRLRISGAPTDDTEAEAAWRDHAVRVGGECTTRRGDDAITLDWRIPVPERPGDA
jgi:signal transduction histidine kinase